MRATAEILYIGRIGRGGAGLLRVGPGLLVGLLARLLVGRLLLLLCLLRIRGLAASRRQGSPGNDGNDRQFRKWDASSVPELLTPTTAHGLAFFRVLHAGLCTFNAHAHRRFPKRRNGQKMPDRAFTEVADAQAASRQLWVVRGL